MFCFICRQLFANLPSQRDGRLVEISHPSSTTFDSAGVVEVVYIQHVTNVQSLRDYDVTTKQIVVFGGLGGNLHNTSILPSHCLSPALLVVIFLRVSLLSALE